MKCSWAQAAPADLEDPVVLAVVDLAVAAGMAILRLARLRASFRVVMAGMAMADVEPPVAGMAMEGHMFPSEPDGWVTPLHSGVFHPARMLAPILATLCQATPTFHLLVDMGDAASSEDAVGSAGSALVGLVAATHAPDITQQDNKQAQRNILDPCAQVYGTGLRAGSPFVVAGKPKNPQLLQAADFLILYVMI